MATDFTTTALVASIRRRGFLPAGSGLSSESILQYASEELRSYIPAFLKGIREEFIVTTADLSAVGGSVTLPAAAVGASLRTVGWLQSDGRVRPLPRVEPENAGGLTGQTGEPIGYMFQGNTALLLPAPTSGTVRLAYQARPAQLVLPAACAKITSFGPGQILVEGHPASLELATSYDIVSATPNFPLDAADIAGTWDSDTEFTPDDASVATSVAAGDYICAVGESCIPRIPTEVHDLLAQSAAYKIAQATGSARLSAIKEGLTELREQMTLILSPRSDGSARPIISNSRLGRWGWW